jgi:hypothetical protein
MSTIPKARSKETAMISPVNHKKMPSKNSPADYIINIESLVITDPIDSTRISKMSTNGLSVSSAVKAGLVFLGTVGAYYLAKTTGIFSYFGLGEKNSNPKDVGNSGIMKVKNRENALTVRTNLETTRQADSPSVNRIEQTYKDKDSNLKFKEIKVEEFKDLSKAEENMGIRGSSSRRSISVQNPISDQNVIVGNLFDLTIDDTSVFSSSEALFLETTNIPTWLTSSNPNPTFKGSYDTPGFAHGVALSGNYAYVADYTSGLQVIDISDPSNPTFKGSYDTPGSAREVAVSFNYAYVSDGGSLQIIDISDPSNPTFKGLYDTPGNALGIALSNNYAYVADSDSGLQIIAPNLDKLILSGIPSSIGTYGVDIEACNELAECVTDSFDIIVRDIDDTTDTMDVTDTTDLTNSIVIIGSMTVAVCVTCIASFSLPLIIGAVIVMLRRHRNKILGKEDNTKEKELKEIKELKE